MNRSKQLIALVLPAVVVLASTCKMPSQDPEPAETYSVVYDPNGATSGAVPVDSGEYEAGQAVTVKGNTGKLRLTAHAFALWNTAAGGSGTDYAPGSVLEMGSEDITLFATWAPSGSLDSGFGTGGWITTDLGGVVERVSAIAIQASGKIVAAGCTGSTLSIARYNSDGSLDTSLDGDGTTTIDPTYGGAVAFQPDGKILATGGGTDFALVRFNADGTLDTSLDVDGKVTTDTGSDQEGGTAIAIQSDAKILVAGTRFSGTNYSPAILIRYNADGSLDTDFGSGGISPIIWFSMSGFSVPSAVAIQSDAKIVVTGRYGNPEPHLDNQAIFVARLNADGSLDTEFDGDGKLTTSIGKRDYGYSVALQTDGKIVVAGLSINDETAGMALVRYNADGSLDTEFDEDGILTTAIGASSDAGRALAIQPDGKILVAGCAYSGGASDFAVVRYSTDGSLDTDFDVDGKVSTAMGTADSYAYALEIQPDGRIVVAGQAGSGGTSDFALARYWP